MRRLDAFNLFELLDMARGGCLDKKQALKKVASDLNVRPQATVYVDDNCIGLTDAKSLGIITIGFLDGWQLPDQIRMANPSFTASTIHDVAKIVRSLQAQGVT